MIKQLKRVLPEEFLHEAVKALDPAILGRLDGLGSVGDEGQHRCVLSQTQRRSWLEGKLQLCLKVVGVGGWVSEQAALTGLLSAHFSTRLKNFSVEPW